LNDSDQKLDIFYFVISSYDEVESRILKNTHDHEKFGIILNDTISDRNLLSQLKSVQTLKIDLPAEPS
jgi:hypothetical protein